LYILLVVCTGLLVWAAVAIYLRVRRHLRPSKDHGLSEIRQEQGQPKMTGKDS